jgi:peptide/nickel transport system substrate-binding protein
MTEGNITRRGFLGGAALTGGLVVLEGCSLAGDGGGTAGGPSGLPPIEGGTVITDRAAFPTKFSESPGFAAMTASGKLPPVAQRIGQDPLVIKPVHGIGKYGGELRRGFITVGDLQNGRRFATGPDTLLYWDYQFKNVVPNLAREYELSDDAKVLTLRLRRGMRWSDGHPFTADDIIFWREDINLNPDLSPGASFLSTEDGPVEVRKVDDYTVEYVAPVPHPVLPRLLAGNITAGLSSDNVMGEGGYAPKHYLSQFLPKYTSEAEVSKKAKAAGAASWELYLEQRMDWSANVELPVLGPWKLTRPVNNAPWVLEANPYSVWVDTKGNQLPYIPKITMRDAGNPEVLKTQAVSGAYDFQDRGLDLSALQVLVQNQKRSSYTVYRAPSTNLDLLVRLNLAYDKDKTIGELIRNVDFRRALSLGIDRDEVNKTFLLDTGTPSATMVADDSPYFPGRDWRSKWATHDVKQANQLLDKIGLTEKDGEGYRLRPDNKQRVRMDFDVVKSNLDYPGVAELIKRNWRDIGIDVTVKVGDNVAFANAILGNTMMLNVLGGISVDVFLDRVGVLPTGNVQGAMGLPYGRWLESGGKKGTRPPKSLGLEEAYELWQSGLRADEARRVEIGREIFKMHEDMVWSIGLVGFGIGVYGLYLAKNNLGNVPRRMINGNLIRTPSNALPMTFYFRS